MSEQLDNIIQQMTDLTNTVKEHATDRATLDEARVKEIFSEQIEALRETQMQEKQEPNRRIPGEVQRAGDLVDAGIVKAGPYSRMLKDFQRDGYSKVGANKVRPVDLYLANLLMSKAHGLLPDRVAEPSDDLKAAIKAMTSTGTGAGDELVPTGMANELWEDFFLASRVASLFDTIEMPTNPFDVPLGLGDVTWRKGSENTATTATDLTTAKSTLTATELVAEVQWSYTLQEDSIVALMPAVRRRLGISGAEVIDAFVLNADSTASSTGNINLDNATPPADAYYLSAGQDGIRHLPLVDNTDMANTAGGDALGDTDITGILAEMGKYAVNPEQVAMICDVSTYLNGFLKLDNVTTMDKFGDLAVVLTGQLAAYRGIPIIVSASMPLTMADGKVDSSGNTLGSIAVVNRSMWYVGFRRNLLIEVDRDIQRRQYIMVLSLREAVAAHGTRASATHTGLIYNILV